MWLHSLSELHVFGAGVNFSRGVLWHLGVNHVISERFLRKILFSVSLQVSASNDSPLSSIHELVCRNYMYIYILYVHIVYIYMYVRVLVQTCTCAYAIPGDLLPW